MSILDKIDKYLIHEKRNKLMSLISKLGLVNISPSSYKIRTSLDTAQKRHIKTINSLSSDNDVYSYIKTKLLNKYNSLQYIVNILLQTKHTFSDEFVNKLYVLLNNRNVDNKEEK